MLAKMLARPMEASFHRCDACIENLGDFSMAVTFLDERKQRPILRSQLSQRVAERIEFLGIHGTGRLGNVFMLLAEGEKYPPQLLPPQLIDARISRQAKEPGFELRGCLQAIECTNHLDEHLLRQIFDVIAPAGHGVNEAGNPMLVADNKLPLGGFVALLGSPHEVGQRSR